MPIRDIQITLREVGRIRCGDQVAVGKGRKPRKLDRFRFTSDDPQLLAVVADLYGGDVEPWEAQYQVYISAERIPVMMVPGLRPITQWMEAWSAGGCIRRCDGYRDQISGTPCPCAAQDERICKPTTRLHVILPDIPGLGTWRLESHGYYAAVELGGTVELITKLAQATGDPVHGTLRLTQRTQKVHGQPVRHFAVPTLDISVTVPDLVQRIAQAAVEAPETIDGAQAGRLQALAAAGATGPHRGLHSPAEQEAAEGRAQARRDRKRTPDLGPGNRRRTGGEHPQTVDDLVAYGDSALKQAFDSPLSDGQRKALHALFRSTGLSDRDERLNFSARIIGRSISTSNDLTSREASQIIDVLAAVEQGSAEYVTDDTGRITGAVAVVADLADPIHDDPSLYAPSEDD